MTRSTGNAQGPRSVRSTAEPKERPEFQPLGPAEAAVDVPIFSTREFVSLMGRSRLWILLLCLATGLIVFIASREAMQVSPGYTSSVEIEILPGELELSFARSALGGSRDAQVASVVRSISEELKSDAVLAAAVADVFGAEGDPEASGSAGDGKMARWLNWLNYGSTSLPARDPLDSYREALDISWIDGSFVLRISATLPDPERAAQFANAVFAAYDDRQRSDLNKIAATMRSAYVGKIDEAEAALQTLVEREHDLSVAPSGLALPPEGMAPAVSTELVLNRQKQDVLVREIAAMRSELAAREIEIAALGPQASVLREAKPSALPDGPTPLVRAIAYTAGLFVFLVACIVMLTVLRSVRRKADAQGGSVF